MAAPHHAPQRTSAPRPDRPAPAIQTARSPTAPPPRRQNAPDRCPSPCAGVPYKEHLRKVMDIDRVRFVGGGGGRWESVLFGLRALADLAEAPKFVAVHDAARPLTPRSVIDEAFRMTLREG